MKFSKNSFSTLLACLFTIISFAQTTSEYDPKAKAILDEVHKAMKTDTTISATFTITMKKADGTVDRKTGTMQTKGDKYKITLGNKLKDKIKTEEYYNNGKTTAVYSEKENCVTHDIAPPPSQNPNAISPNRIFTIFEMGFKYTFIKEDTLNGRVVQYIDLYPEKPEKKNYHTVHLIIDKDLHQIISIEFINKDGSTTTYTVDSFTPNLPIPDSTFDFDPTLHPGSFECPQPDHH